VSSTDYVAALIERGRAKVSARWQGAEHAQPERQSSPLLHLEVMERQGVGVFSPVSYIQRLNTTGGVGPSGACETDALRWVIYPADYYFYATQG
jgi:hypothetical protein